MRITERRLLTPGQRNSVFSTQELSINPSTFNPNDGILYLERPRTGNANPVLLIVIVSVFHGDHDS
ncbi:hypothetical protein MPTK1_5g08760 [Marchantia polymorpha subsp. ruderalis]|nr:hypothetical protein MARPO_0086s0085 [Marchantia polymorpha]BBN11067.1 hypothetical protein Mp_5g08760 [Marchantia polymorpha subsp. ruderalis]PTQ33772.1 hypothetical protein MARPO_0086s0085 [Marchantia polymorpha]PTQ33773.1 hypothetical protein MARPO_0086s0085 [Marchantia polymorpha]BBN11068.1 hypothetical protein Mp_5g08760 [Marchantia polymorpha subsp. ruderalis]|eukprot:PTQ33771.1 hypothetical protein MARPO_0086s0085 [Marchantia polymorpha]